MFNNNIESSMCGQKLIQPGLFLASVLMCTKALQGLGSICTRPTICSVEILFANQLIHLAERHIASQ